MEKGRSRSSSPQFSPVLFLCSRFLNSADPNRLVVCRIRNACGKANISFLMQITIHKEEKMIWELRENF